MNAGTFEPPPPQVQTLLESWPVWITLPVQWGDQDALGHVNNVVFFRWFESARVALLQQLGVRTHDQQRLGTILAATDCNYRRPLTYPDTVYACAAVLRTGNTSITMAQQIVSARQQQVAAWGRATVVVFDYMNRHPVPIPPSMRQKLQGLMLPETLQERFA